MMLYTGKCHIYGVTLTCYLKHLSPRCNLKAEGDTQQKFSIAISLK